MSWKEICQKYPEANFLQSPEYAKMNELIGDKAVVIEHRGGWSLTIVRNALRGRYLEIPCGPLMDWQDSKTVAEMLKLIRELGVKERCGFARLRPQLIKTPANMQILQQLGLRESPMHLAAEHTVMIDLKTTPDEMLARMRRQTRYEVRKAAKLGIKVEKSRSEAIFREFHQVQRETANRQHFVPPTQATLLAEREAFGKDITIYTARTPEEEPIAYGLVIQAGQEGDYYEAASTPLGRKLPGAAAIIWQAMQDLHEQGYQRFNLWGIAPPDQPGHRYAGVTTFKKGFGGEVVEYVPAHDMVIDRLKYGVDWTIETIRHKRRRL